MNKHLICLLFAFSLGTQAHGSDAAYAYFGMGGAIQYGCEYGIPFLFKKTLTQEPSWGTTLFCGLFTGTVLGVTAARDQSVNGEHMLLYGVAGMGQAIFVRRAFALPESWGQ